MRVIKSILLAFAASVACIILCESSALAILVPELDVTELEKGAQVIVVGEVTSTIEVERGIYRLRGYDVTARIVEATISVERTLKGKASAEYKVRFYEPDAMLGYDWTKTSSYGLFFLKREGDHYIFVSSYHFSVVARRGDCTSEGNPLARVATEMVCLLRSEKIKMRDRYEAIKALTTIKTETGTAALKLAVEEQPEPLNYLAADELIKRGDLSMLSLAEHALQKSAEITIKEDGFSLSTGWNSIEDISDRRAIPFLSRLVHAPDQGTRQDVLRALGQTKDKAAIVPLLEGLDDKEAGVRWYAVMGLAELAGADDEGGEWYPDFKKFEENEALYITHWKVWAVSQGKDVRPENN